VKIGRGVRQGYYSSLIIFNIHSEVLEGLGDFKLGKKAVPLQAWTGPQGSRRSRLPDF
jgi:hypothetical protein